MLLRQQQPELGWGIDAGAGLLHHQQQHDDGTGLSPTLGMFGGAHATELDALLLQCGGDSPTLSGLVGGGAVGLDTGGDDCEAPFASALGLPPAAPRAASPGGELAVMLGGGCTGGGGRGGGHMFSPAASPELADSDGEDDGIQALLLGTSGGARRTAGTFAGTSVGVTPVALRSLAGTQLHGSLPGGAGGAGIDDEECDLFSGM